MILHEVISEILEISDFEAAILNKSSQWLPSTPFASISECLVSYLCLGLEHEEGHGDPILVKHELNMLCNLLNV